MPTPPSSSDLTRQQLEDLDALLQRMLSGTSVKSEVQKPLDLPRTVPLPLPPDHSTVVSARVPMPSMPSARETVVDKLTERIDTSALHRREPVEEMAELPTPAVNRIPMPQPIRKDDELPKLDWLRLPTPTAPETPSYPPVPVTPAVAYDPPMPSMQTLPLAPIPEPRPMPQYGRIELNETVGTAVSTPPLAPPVERLPIDTETTSANAATPGVPVLMWPVYVVNWFAEGMLKLFGGEALTTNGAKTLMGWTGVLLIIGAGLWTAYGYAYISPPK